MEILKRFRKTKFNEVNKSLFHNYTINKTYYCFDYIKDIFL